MSIFDCLKFSAEEVGQLEVEDVFYIRIDDPLAAMEGLGINDSVEHHDQYEINGDTSRVRVRKTTRNSETFYEMTKKLLCDKFINGENEFTESISEFVFECYKEMSPSGMIKSRYVKYIPEYPGVKFEFDLFYLPDGSISNWCKVDLEIPDGGFKGNYPKVPAIYSEIIPGSDPERNTDIRELYDTIFITRSNTRLVELPQ